MRQNVVVERYHDVEASLGCADEKRWVVGVGKGDDIDAGLTGGTGPAMVGNDEIGPWLVSVTHCFEQQLHRPRRVRVVQLTAATDHGNVADVTHLPSAMTDAMR
jgi:hypothetical protein